MHIDIFHIILIIIALVAIVRLCYAKNTAISGLEELKSGKKNTNNFVNIWVQQIMYTRLLMMAYFENNPEEKYIIDRLFQNQVDMSKLFSNIYGEQHGHSVLYAMVGHMKNIIAFLEAIKSGNQKKFDSSLENIYNDVDKLGAFYDKITGKNIFKKLIRTHTEALVNNFLAYYYKNYPRDIKTLDEYLNTATMIAVEMALVQHQTN